MASETPEPAGWLLDEWIGEVGEAGVLAAIEDTRRRVADGSLPAFTDADALAEYWNAHHAIKA